MKEKIMDIIRRSLPVSCISGIDVAADKIIKLLGKCCFCGIPYGSPRGHKEKEPCPMIYVKTALLPQPGTCPKCGEGMLVMCPKCEYHIEP